MPAFFGAGKYDCFSGMPAKGVGRSLLLCLEQMARERACTQIILVTEKNRLDACAFYEACGFQQENTGYKKKL